MVRKSKPNSKQQAEYNQEFKETAVQLAVKGNKPVSVVARELGLPEWKLRDWSRAWKKKNGSITVSNSSKNLAEEELRKLQKRNRELELEVEILKKASAYFARTLL